MAVSNYDGEVFTYMLDQHTSTWVGNGKLSVPGDWSHVSIRNDLMVATITDVKNHPDVCGIVYKLTTTNNNNSRYLVCWCVGVCVFVCVLCVLLCWCVCVGNRDSLARLFVS